MIPLYSSRVHFYFYKVFLVTWFCYFWGSRVCLYTVLVTLQWVFGKVCSRCILFDPSLVPHWGTRPWLICAITDAAWNLTSSFHFCLLNCVFRFLPTSIFIVKPSLDRLPTKAEDTYPAMRRLVIPHQTPTWKFQDHECLLSLLLLLWLLLTLYSNKSDLAFYVSLKLMDYLDHLKR